MKTPVIVYLRSDALPPLRSLPHLPLFVTFADDTPPESPAPLIVTLSLPPVITK